MKKATVKKIFIFFLIFLPLQYAVVGLVGVRWSEPWPALVLPAFKSVTPADSSVQFKTPHFVVRKDKNVYTLEMNQLFDELSRAKRVAFMEDHFYMNMKINDMNQRTRLWLRHQLERSLPPGTKPDTLKINWVQTSIRLPKNSQPVFTTRMVKTLTLPFK